MAMPPETLSVRIPPELRTDLSAAAWALDRTIGWVVRTAIREWLEREANMIEANATRSDYRDR